MYGLGIPRPRWLTACRRSSQQVVHPERRQPPNAPARSSVRTGCGGCGGAMTVTARIGDRLCPQARRYHESPRELEPGAADRPVAADVRRRRRALVRLLRERLSRRGGLPRDSQPWLRYCPWIEGTRAQRRGRLVLALIGRARPGDLVLLRARPGRARRALRRGRPDVRRQHDERRRRARSPTAEAYSLASATSRTQASPHAGPPVPPTTEGEPIRPTRPSDHHAQRERLDTGRIVALVTLVLGFVGAAAPVHGNLDSEHRGHRRWHRRPHRDRGEVPRRLAAVRGPRRRPPARRARAPERRHGRGTHAGRRARRAGGGRLLRAGDQRRDAAPSRRRSPWSWIPTSRLRRSPARLDAEEPGADDEPADVPGRPTTARSTPRRRPTRS